MASPFADPDVLFGLELKEPWASMVLDGSKTIETRTYDLPAELIDRPLVLLATPEHSGSAGHSGLADVVTDRGAATILGLVTFGGVVEWESREAWSRDREKHGVPDDDDGPYVWREDDAAIESRKVSGNPTSLARSNVALDSTTTRALCANSSNSSASFLSPFAIFSSILVNSRSKNSVVNFVKFSSTHFSNSFELVL